MDKDFPVCLADIELRRDLIKAGYTDRDIARQVALGELTKLRYGAYVRSSLLAGLDDVGLMRVRSRAVLRTAHEASVLSHQASLAEWDIPVWGVSLSEAHLTRTDGKAGRRESGIVHHSATLGKREWTLRHGVPVVTVARAVVEVVLAQRPRSGWSLRAAP